MMIDCMMISSGVGAILIVAMAVVADYVLPRYMSRRTARVVGAFVIIVIGLFLAWSVWECVKGG